MTEADRDLTDDLCAFIDASPSPYHAVESARSWLQRAGFQSVDPADAFPTAPGGYFLARGGALTAWRQGAATPNRYRMIGAHTDSPNLRVKPRPDRLSAGVAQVGVEVYGGALLNSWLDRDLGLSGRVSVRTPQGVDHRLLLVDAPILRVAQLAIHLDRGVTDEGLILNKQEHMAPIWALASDSPGSFAEFIGREVGVDADEILAWDLMTHDLTPSRRIGRDGVFLAAPRLDNLCSSWAALHALVGADDGEATPVVCLFDHEEVGSTSSTGAGASMLVSVIERINAASGGTPESLARALAGSTCVSADMAHATHPNYPDRHEPQHPIALNGGVVVKVNANQRYASDAESIGTFLDSCRDARVPVQHFVGRTDLPCGSTIGPTTAARLGVSTVDVGVAQLSMHSARELCGADDPSYYVAALTAFLRG